MIELLNAVRCHRPSVKLSSFFKGGVGVGVGGDSVIVEDRGGLLVLVLLQFAVEHDVVLPCFGGKKYTFPEFFASHAMRLQCRLGVYAATENPVASACSFGAVLPSNTM